MRKLLTHSAMLLAISAPAFAGTPTPEQVDFFENNIRPIFAETCYECHGPDKQKAELRLDNRLSFEKGGESGPIFNADNPLESMIIEVVEYEGKIKMPEDMKLADADIEAIRQWVQMGAPWPEDDTPVVPNEPEFSFDQFIQETKASHWSFQPVRMPETPQPTNADWAEAPVDNFILAKLEEAGLEPSPAASRRTLIRRLSYDLIGLPPTPEEVDAFVNDESPDAYANLVERLLASPHYGERWGRHWLDVARYADTKGYVFEEDRFYPYSYTYRDYVVRAFNDDLPFNEFIVQQIAADKLELGDDRRPLAAMGFLTLGRRFINNIHDITDDRIDVVSRGIMGLTVSCARCHDHKYDPVSTADYYAMYGIFRSASEPGEFPLIEEPDENDPQYQEFKRILQEKQQDLTDYEFDKHVELLTEVREKVDTYFTTAHDAMDITDDAEFKTFATERETRHQVLRPWVSYLKKQLEAPNEIYRPYAWFKAIPAESFTTEAPKVRDRVLKATEGDTKVNARVRDAFQGDPPADMANVVKRYADLFVAIDKEWRDSISAHAQIAAQFPETPIPTALEDTEAETVRQEIYGKHSPANIAKGQVYGISDTPVQQQVRRLRRVVARHEATHTGRPDRATTLRDGTPFDPVVFLRGKPGNRGDNVPRRFLTVLAKNEPEPYIEDSGRLQMARAIASDENPLTPRVFVNRVWMHHFGQGLVTTPSDFGLRSEPPTHPALLDYLARSFVDSAWSVKDLHRMIVNSAAYKQSSNHRADGEEIDIENRLVWRQNRKRLEFEAIRDSLLQAAGTLDLAIGGPPESLTDDDPTTRRAIYGLVERQNMAGFIKAFDFASPDTHSPKRFNTIVPQQALYLMNSPFVIEQAKSLEARTTSDNPDPIARINELFEICYQRPPSPEEAAAMLAFIEREDFDHGPPPPPPSAWQYGWGYYDTDTKRTASFTAFEVYKDERWMPMDEYPNDTYGHAMLSPRYGHPGNVREKSAVRRWVAPRDGTVELSARLRHKSDKGDGVIGYIVSNRIGLIHEYAVFNGFNDAKHEGIPVNAGDTIDFIGDPNTGPSFDSFQWSITINMDRPENTEGQSILTTWDARADFAGPPPTPPEPLSPWGQLAQVMLLTNEFLYVD